MAPKTKDTLSRPGGSGVRGGSLRRRSADAPKKQDAPLAVASIADSSPSSGTLITAPAAAELTSPDVGPGLDFQSADLVLTASRSARHCFRLQFELVESAAGRSANHYVLIVPRIRTQQHGHPCFSQHDVRIEGATVRGKAIQTFEFEHFVLANVPFSALSTLLVEHKFTVHKVELQRRGSVESMPIPDLSREERLACLSDNFYRCEKIRVLLAEQQLARTPGERDVAYAARLASAMCERFEFDAAATEESLHLLPTLVFERGRGDSRAFNAGFVYALRASGVPAKLNIGLKYGPEVLHACGEYAANYVQCEFYADHIGWVPCDATGGIQSCSWKDLGSKPDFIAWHAASLSRAEAREFAEVMRSASCDLNGVLLRVHKVCERRGLKPGESLSLTELNSVVGAALGVAEDVASRRVTEVLAFCETAGVPGSAFTDGYAAIELGQCPIHFGSGKNPCATGLVGAALFEGGPYEDGVPLDAEAIVETRLVLRGHEQVAAGTPTQLGWNLPRDNCSLFRVTYEVVDIQDQ